MYKIIYIYIYIIVSYIVLDLFECLLSLILEYYLQLKSLCSGDPGSVKMKPARNLSLRITSCAALLLYFSWPCSSGCVDVKIWAASASQSTTTETVREDEAWYRELCYVNIFSLGFCHKKLWLDVKLFFLEDSWNRGDFSWIVLHKAMRLHQFYVADVACSPSHGNSIGRRVFQVLCVCRLVSKNKTMRWCVVICFTLCGHI